MKRLFSKLAFLLCILLNFISTPISYGASFNHNDLSRALFANNNLVFQNHTIFTGAIDPVNLTIDAGSVWNVTGNSILNNLIHAGFINFVPNGNHFKALLVNNYLGLNGTIQLNSFLGSGGASSDVIIIEHSATGTTRIIIKNTNGGGAPTLGNGILIVKVQNGDVTSITAFHLLSPVVAGPYEYILIRGTRDGNNQFQFNWYLINIYPPQPPTPTPIPVPIPPYVVTIPVTQTQTHAQIPQGVNVPIYRREVSLATALPSTALLYDHELLGTLHARVGEEEQLMNRSDNGINHFANGYWLRVLNQNGEFKNSGIYRAGPSFHYNFNALELGADIYHALNINGTSDFAGVFVAYGRDRGDVDHVRIVKAGDYHFNASSIGGYYTHFDPNGWYVDSVLLDTYHEMSANSNRGFRSMLANGSGLTGSVEAGFNIPLIHDISIEPEAQLALERLWLNESHTENLLNFSTTNSCLARFGARLTRSFDTKTARLITTWIFANIWHEFAGNSRTNFSSLLGDVPFNSELNGNSSDVGIGISAMLTRDVTIFGTGNETSFWNSHGNSAGFDAGIRINL